MLEQGAVGQTNGEASEIFLDQSAQDIASQSSASVNLYVELGFGRDVLKLHSSFPFFEGLGDELLFDLALDQNLIDALELIAQLLVVDVAFDGGQRGLEGLLNGK